MISNMTALEDASANNTKDMPLTERLVLTIAEAGTLTGFKRQVLDQAVLAGNLKLLKQPGVRRISRKELDRWIDSLTER